MKSKLSTLAKIKKSKAKLLTVCVIAIIAVAAAVWKIWFYIPPSKVITKAGNLPPTVTSSTNKVGSSTNSTSSSSPKTSTGNSNTTRTIGGAVDTQGKTNSTTPENQWITSKSGVITVEQPVANATLTSGSYLSGTASVSTVDYTLLDDNVGVISQGSLSVINGKFSGKMIFMPHSSGGRLDVFSTNNQGVELNEIQIGVRF